MVILLYVFRFELLVGNAPFEAKDQKQMFENITNLKYHIPSYVSKEANRLIRNMLRSKGSDRMPLQDIASNHWVQSLRLPRDKLIV